MDHKCLNDKGSFKAWGVGLHYEFDASSNIIDVHYARLSRPIIYIDTDDVDERMILDYVYMLERVSQLYALNFSNKTSVDITEILSLERLKPIIKQISHSALLGLYLSEHKFSSFNQSFNAEHSDHKLLIKKTRATHQASPYYMACMKTNYGVNIPQQRHKNLHIAIERLSSDISTTMITNQIIRSANDHLSASLKISSELFLLSMAIDPRLTPTRLMLSHCKQKQNRRRA